MLPLGNLITKSYLLICFPSDAPSRPALKSTDGKGTHLLASRIRHLEGPQKNAFSAPPVGRASSAVFCAKFSGFDTDSSRSYAKWFCKKVFLVVFVFLLTP